MTDLKLDTAGDLDTSMPGVLLVDGAARVAQQVRTRLRTFKGEWEFDLDAGVPWFERVLAIKGVNLNDVDTVLKTEIQDVADVVSILSFSLTLDHNSRQATITAKINTTFGQAVVEDQFP